MPSLSPGQLALTIPLSSPSIMLFIQGANQFMKSPYEFVYPLFILICFPYRLYTSNIVCCSLLYSQHQEGILAHAKFPINSC